MTAIFGSEDWPLRPSKMGKLLKCTMSVAMDGIMNGDSEGGKGAQTGSVVHAGVERFHRVLGAPITRQEEALAAARESLPSFPLADEENAFRWLNAYVKDQKNILADVRWVEEKVRLVLPADPDIVVAGTLDQVRVLSKPDYLKMLIDSDRMDMAEKIVQSPQAHYLTVWDLKTGASLKADDAVTEYQAQQATYVLAARQTLDASILPGGLIFAAGYDLPRGRRFLPMGLDIADCDAILDTCKQRVLDYRAGRRDFTPSNSSCFFCDHKRYPRCSQSYKESQS